MRLKKSKEPDAKKSQQIDCISRLICTSKTQTHPLSGTSATTVLVVIFLCFLDWYEPWWKRWKDKNPRLVRASSRNDTSNGGYWSSVPSVLWRCWLGGRKGIRPVKSWVVGCWRGCLGWGADLHIAQRMPLPLTISCSGESRLVLTFLVLPVWYLLTRVVPDVSQKSSKTVVCVCVCVCGYWIYVMVLWKNVASQRTWSQVWYYQFTKRKGI